MRESKFTKTKQRLTDFVFCYLVLDNILLLCWHPLSTCNLKTYVLSSLCDNPKKLIFIILVTHLLLVVTERVS